MIFKESDFYNGKNDFDHAKIALNHRLNFKIKFYFICLVI